MKSPFLPSVIVALSLSLMGCKESYSSLSSDPVKRKKEVRACQSSEVLAQVVIYEKIPEIRQLAGSKLVDPNCIVTELKKLDQKELADLILDTHQTQGIISLCIPLVTDDKTLEEIVLHAEFQYIAEECFGNIKSDDIIFNLLNSDLKHSIRNPVKKEIRQKMLIDPKFTRLSNYHYGSLTSDFTMEEVLKVIASSGNDTAKINLIRDVQGKIERMPDDALRDFMKIYSKFKVDISKTTQSSEIEGAIKKIDDFLDEVKRTHESFKNPVNSQNN